MGKAEFCRRQTPNAFYLPTATTISGTTQSYGNKFYLAIDTELLNFDSESLYSGISMGTNSIALPRQATQYFWMCYDAFIEFDLTNGITTVVA